MYFQRDDKQMLKANLAEIVKACEKAGITRIDINYSGSGDSGEINETFFAPALSAGTLADIKVSQKSVKLSWDQETKERKSESVVRDVSLEEAVDDYFYDTCHQYDIDFNNEGCEGSYAINIAEHTLEVENQVFFTNSESHSFDEEIDLV